MWEFTLDQYTDWGESHENKLDKYGFLIESFKEDFCFDDDGDAHMAYEAWQIANEELKKLL
jgi:hypothetical protein